MNPELSRSEALQLLRHVIPLNAAEGILKKTVQEVQITRSDQTNITSAQQYHWNHLVDQIYNMLCEKKTDFSKKSGKTFGVVMAHFIAGLDEICFMSDAHGSMYIVGVADKRKHEKVLQDSNSITVVWTCTVVGTTEQTSSS